MKKKIIIAVLFFFITFGLLSALAIWNIFLDDYIPHHRTFFVDYQSFRKKAFGIKTVNLPESGHDIKFYVGTDRFIKTHGYGVTLSEEDFIDSKCRLAQVYQNKIEKLKNFEGLTSGVYLEEDNPLEGTWLDEYDIRIMQELLLEGEEVEDLSIIAFCYIDNGSFSYLNCVFCDKNENRIFEIYRCNTYKEVNGLP